MSQQLEEHETMPRRPTDNFGNPLPIDESEPDYGYGNQDLDGEADDIGGQAETPPMPQKTAINVIIHH